MADTSWMTIHHKSQKTPEVTSKSIRKSFRTMNLRRYFEAVCGVSGVLTLIKQNITLHFSMHFQEID